MKRYKIILDQVNCIGAGSCVAVQPERWKLNSDDKAEIIGGFKDEKGDWIMECTAEELERFLESARVCPVNVIHIIDLETGAKII